MAIPRRQTASDSKGEAQGGFRAGDFTISGHFVSVASTKCWAYAPRQELIGPDFLAATADLLG